MALQSHNLADRVTVRNTHFYHSFLGDGDDSQFQCICIVGYWKAHSIERNLENKFLNKINKEWVHIIFHLKIASGFILCTTSYCRVGSMMQGHVRKLPYGFSFFFQNPKESRKVTTETTIIRKNWWWVETNLH